MGPLLKRAHCLFTPLSNNDSNGASAILFQTT